MDKTNVVADLGVMHYTMIANDMFNPVHLRYTVTLDHEINELYIAQAWERTKRVYPVIDTVLRAEHGDMDYYLKLDPEKANEYAIKDHLYLVKPENGVSTPIKSKIPVRPGTPVHGGRIIGISYYGNSISLSSFHSIADGTGLKIIFSTFLYSYLALYTGHEDTYPVVELTEGRALSEYYVPLTLEYVCKQEYTPAPIFSMPFNTRGFLDKDMVRDNTDVFAGNLAISAEDFLHFCKQNGSNPSAMLCTLLAKAAYELNPEEENDIVFSITSSVRPHFGLDRSIANAFSLLYAYTSRKEIENSSIEETAGKLRHDIHSQRSKDSYISFCHLMANFALAPQFKERIVTYIGDLNIGDNTPHIQDFSMVTNSVSNLYMMQVNDNFIMTLQYGLATEKYLDKFVEIFTELGIRVKKPHAMHVVENDTVMPVL